VKKVIKILGIIAVIAMIGLSITACDDELAGTGTGTGTVIVRNNSPYTLDAKIHIELCPADAPNSPLAVETEIVRGGSITWTSVPIGRSLKVWVLDGIDAWYVTAPFTLLAGGTRTFNFIGTDNSDFTFDQYD